MTKNKNNYKDSGVNIEEGQKFIEQDDLQNQVLAAWYYFFSLVSLDCNSGLI